jgi:Zn-dependent protease with chaperone function
MATYLYPPSPENVPPALTEPSAAFKKEVSGVMGSIVVFFIVYVLLLVLSIALVIGCFYAGVAIIINAPRLITIVAGLGLMGVGVMIFIFLIKFIFSVSRYDKEHIVEIKEEEQPALFEFIRQLTKDTHTKFPKKIYLSADANACVFYDSSFWSMFFPVKKNLQIGLGLVNALNLSEFKAVMAHEFGHFSQRSMKLGSFVYNVNKVIHNMLFENKGFTGFLRGWANIDGIFALFAQITAGIAQGIQGILRGMYGFINKKYMGLSRQMEFHADAVAASVSGSKSLGTALRRIELAAACYDMTLEKCDVLFRQKKVCQNIFPNQHFMMLYMAEQHKFPLEGGLPVITDEFISNHNLSRVNFKDQWASHPSTDDRIAHLNKLAIPAEVSHEPAWHIFHDKEALQKRITAKIYEMAPVPEDAERLDDESFGGMVQEDLRYHSFPEEYNCFYDNRQVTEPQDVFRSEPGGATAVKFEDIFTVANSRLPKKINSLMADIELVKAIEEKGKDIKTFDFDGDKYVRADAPRVIDKLEEELKFLKQQQETADREAILYFWSRALLRNSGEGNELRRKYQSYFELRKRSEEFLKQMNDMLGTMGSIFSGDTIPVEQINVIIDDLKSQYEPEFKKGLTFWLEAGAYDSDPGLKKRVSDFTQTQYRYFTGSEFIDRQLQELYELANDNWSAVSKFLFAEFRDITKLQLKYRDQ